MGTLLSSPFTGYLFVLRTRGRRSGRMREVPLGYVIIDGNLYCAAGWGDGTSWLKNIEANPTVEAVLPGRTFNGTAVRVTDPAEWTRAYRRLIASFGVLGRLMVGDITRLDDATLLAEHASIPIVRIQPSGVMPGALDPGGRFWVVPLVGAVLVAAAGALWRRPRPSRR